MAEEQKPTGKLSGIAPTSEPSVPNQEACNGDYKSKNPNGGPYSKKDRDARIEEVGRLHFEYGYSANKISELIGANRNTVNSDIAQLFSALKEDWEKTPTLSLLQSHVVSVFAQKRRLREQLDSTEKTSERLAIEKLLLKVDLAICQFHLSRGKFGFCKPNVSLQ